MAAVQIAATSMKPSIKLDKVVCRALKPKAVTIICR